MEHKDPSRSEASSKETIGNPLQEGGLIQICMKLWDESNVHLQERRNTGNGARGIELLPSMQEVLAL